MTTAIVGKGLIVGMLLVSGNVLAAEYDSPQQRNQGPGGGPSRVPPESAISACIGKPEGTACQVTAPNGTKQGACAYTPDKKYYACKPSDMNMPGGPPPQK